MRGESSNFREALNLVARLEKLAHDGELNGQEIFLLTDNIVFEGTFYKGHSQDEKLTDLVLRLRKVELEHQLVLHVIHIAGTRMKAAGIDGLSRGDLLDGMMAGKDPLQYIPLNKGAGERSGGKVEEWVRSWWSRDDGEPLLGR